MNSIGDNVKLCLSIYDHSIDNNIGWHYRGTHEISDEWKKIIQDENNSAKKLNKEELTDRLSIKTIGNRMLLTKSTNVVSGGRAVIKSASLQIDFESALPIWENKFSSLIDDALNTESNGGEIPLTIPESDFPESMSYYLIEANKLFDKSGMFTGFSINEIMSLWSILAPDIRLNTDVIIGPHTDEEVKNNGANNFWFGDPKPKEKSAPEGFISDNNLTPERTYSEFPIKLLRDSIILADSTGLTGEEWISTVAANMEREGHGSYFGIKDFLSIRLLLSKKDVIKSRRAAWRRNSVETLAKDPKNHSYQFYKEGGGLLTIKELSLIKPGDILQVITPALEINNHQETEALLKLINGCIPLLPANQIVKLLTIVPFYWAEGEYSDNFQEIMVYLLSNHQSLWNHIIKQAEIVDGYEGLTVDKLRGILRQKGLSTSGKKSHLVKRISRNSLKPDLLIHYFMQSGVLIQSNQYLKSISGLEIEDNGDSLKHFSSKSANFLFLSNHLLFRLNWDDEYAVSKEIGMIHARCLSKQGIELSLKQLLKVNSNNNIKLLKSYIAGLEIELTANRKKMVEVALVVAEHTKSDSIWYKTIFTSSSRSEIKQYMNKHGLTINDLPTDLILRLYNRKPKLFGWPSLFNKIDKGLSPYQACQLHLFPSLFARLRFAIGNIMFLLILTLPLVMILGAYTPYLTLDFLPLLPSSLSIPPSVNDYIILVLFWAFASITYFRYRTQIAKLSGE